MPGNHNKLIIVAALALANQTETAIDFLCFSHFHIDIDEGSFEMMLACNNVVGEFKIDRCVMSAQAIKSLQQGLEQSTSIQTLYLDLTARANLDVSKLLQETKSIKSLYLHIHSEGTIIGLESLPLSIKDATLNGFSNRTINFTNMFQDLLSNPNLHSISLEGGFFLWIYCQHC